MYPRNTGAWCIFFKKECKRKHTGFLLTGSGTPHENAARCGGRVFWGNRFGEVKKDSVKGVFVYGTPV
jgi:hypothetical protein